MVCEPRAGYAAANKTRLYTACNVKFRRLLTAYGAVPFANIDVLSAAASAAANAAQNMDMKLVLVFLLNLMSACSHFKRVFT